MYNVASRMAVEMLFDETKWFTVIVGEKKKTERCLWVDEMM